LDKFPWFVRIAQGVYPDKLSLSRFQVNGQVVVGPTSTETLKSCVLYKLSYYGFDKLETEAGKPGYDLNRGTTVVSTPINLEYFEEAFTSSSWIVRIFKVKKANLK